MSKPSNDTYLGIFCSMLDNRKPLASLTDEGEAVFSSKVANSSHWSGLSVSRNQGRSSGIFALVPSGK